MPDPAFLPVPELGRLLRLRRLSCAELASDCLDRLERIGPRYAAVAELLRESALAEARERDIELFRGKDRGPLHGIPYGVKHLVGTDATVVSRLRRHGAVLCATLAMADLSGAGADDLPAGRSPWNPSRWSGGSSKCAKRRSPSTAWPLAVDDSSTTSAAITARIDTDCKGRRQS